MSQMIYLEITTRELCEQVSLSPETLVELVEHGILEPQGPTPDEWLFAPRLVSTTRRALRLHQDLGLDWNGVALVLDLLEQRDRLESENTMLRRRLARFYCD